jgi:hypothetical protein
VSAIHEHDAERAVLYGALEQQPGQDADDQAAAARLLQILGWQPERPEL